MVLKLLKDNKFFYYPYLLLFSGAIVLLWVITKGDVTIFFNSHNTVFLDSFFKGYTYVGTMWLCVPIVLFLYYKKKNWGVLLLVSYSVSGLITHVLKRFLIDPNFRPYWGLGHDNFHQVPGVEIKKVFSFPSGHTCTAFVMFLVFSLISKNKKIGTLYLVLAMLVGVSRMYLYQHFFIDTVFGSLIGVSVTTMLYIVFQRKQLLE